ncbi:MAG: glycerate kinase [Hyphomicrobiales bacterium]|nr:MAG: glycerate kinase [Hyphomicrobiales bacterium]
MKLLVAPDSFKGTYTAGEVASHIAEGLEEGGVAAVRLPLADGGEGTIAVLTEALGLEMLAVESCNPWRASCPGMVAMASDGAGFVELAQVNGIPTADEGVRDPITADTYGVGMLMVAAAKAGVSRIVVAAGGSATTDGGLGALRAIEDGGGLGSLPVTVLTDVRTSYTDAARIYGAQKGATAAQQATLTERLRKTAVELKRDPTGVPRTGAAGGFAGGLWAEFDAELVSGADYILDALGFDEQASNAHAVIVGEGRLDAQTSEGKIVSAVLARAAGLARFAVVGSVGADIGALRGEFDGILIATDENAMRAAGRTIAQRLLSSALAAEHSD